MHKKTAALAAIFLVLFAVGAITVVCGAPTMGVKDGDWIEYKVDITGTPPPIHNVTWMRMTILQIQGAAFQANITVRFVNGTLYSSIWKFNFTEGNEEGWISIPSILVPEKHSLISQNQQTYLFKVKNKKLWWAQVEW